MTKMTVKGKKNPNSQKLKWKKWNLGNNKTDFIGPYPCLSKPIKVELIFATQRFVLNIHSSFLSIC